MSNLNVRVRKYLNFRLILNNEMNIGEQRELDPAVNDKEAATFFFSRGEAVRRDSTVCDSRAFSRIVCSLDFNEAVRGIIARERRSKNADIPIVALASNLRDQRS